MHMDVTSILGRGYFSRELPPPFNTASFAAHVAVSTSMPPGYIPPGVAPATITRPCTHNLARSGSLRRKLAIPNPVAMHQLATVVAENWLSLLTYTAGSGISLTTPSSIPGVQRAIEPQHGFDAWPQARARVRAGKRYVLRTDINSFYPSVYTHSIPWAIHTKTVAKRSRGLGHIGNLIDFVVRNGQDQQTVGIPIGPDTSLLLAEILLTSLDKNLAASVTSNGLRYVDDYEFGYMTYSEAETGLASLQEQLSTFELHLNPRKTSIMPLPLPLEGPWTPDLRIYRFRGNPVNQATDLISFFGKAFQLQPSHADESILKYAVSRMRSVTVSQANWPLFEDLLLQAAVVEPGTLSAVVTQFAKYQRAGYPLDVSKIGEAFSSLIEIHSPIGHGSEVAWAIWGCIELGAHIGAEAAKRLSESDDCIVALVALDARSKGLVHSSLSSARWETQMVTSELRGPMWLLAYEASIKGWLPGLHGVDVVAGDTYCSWLRAGGVTFYDQTRRITVPPPTATVVSGSSSGPSEDLMSGY